MENVCVIILTYNEENNIRQCIESVMKISSKIFITDSYSNDKTIQILNDYPVTYVQHPFIDYSAQRNWAQENSPFNTEWVLHIDAGEYLTNDFIDWFKNDFSKESSHCDGFIFSRRVYFLNKWIKYGAMYPNYHLRLFKKSKGHCENKSYDQHFVINGIIKKLPLGLDMIDNSGNDIVEFIQKHCHWAAKEAYDINLESINKGNVSESILGNVIEQKRFFKNQLYYKLPLIWRAFFFFIYRYFFRFGFLDGKTGFIYHFLQCLWFRVTIDAIVIQNQKNVK